MNIIFFGSSKYSTIDEKILHGAFGLSLVVTLPDRQNAKTKQIIPNPVKQFAKDNTIPCLTTEKITPNIVEQIAQYQPDFLVVADFGLILPKALLDLPKKAAINVHHSLLPKYRGPAPVPFAILAGEKIVGVTIILMTPKVDAGDMLAQETYKLLPTDTTDSVLTKLNELGSGLAAQVITNFDTYFTQRKPQDESKATFTHFMKREDGYIDLSVIPVKTGIQREDWIPGQAWNDKVDRMIRAYYPWPGVWTTMKLNGKEIRVKLLPNNMLQAEGKKAVRVKDFLNGYPQAKELVEKLGLL